VAITIDIYTAAGTVTSDIAYGIPTDNVATTSDTYTEAVFGKVTSRGIDYGIPTDNVVIIRDIYTEADAITSIGIAYGIPTDNVASTSDTYTEAVIDEVTSRGIAYGIPTDSIVAALVDEYSEALPRAAVAVYNVSDNGIVATIIY
jgi:hypothetical protein